ncbi:MAG: hypothetical protein ABIL37_03510 [candidate division WOR-3 bacterium]
MIFLLSFWILSEKDSFGNRFISDYPKGIFLELESHRFFGINMNNENLLVQIGIFYEDGSYNKRKFKGFYAGYENAFLNLKFDNFFIIIGRRALKISKTILWDKFSLDGININYVNKKFSYSFWLNKINSIITPESVSLLQKTYPPGYLIDRYLTIRRLEIYSKLGDFYITDYGILPLPYDMNIPFSLLNPFTSSYNLQWNENYETNTILSFTYKNKNFLFEISIDDFQYSKETLDKIPPKLAFWSYFNKSPLKLEILYAMPYTFNNKRYVSKWIIYNEIPSLIGSDEIKLILSYYKNENFISLGLKFKGSLSVYNSEKDYVFHLPLVEPVKSFLIFRAFKDFNFNDKLIRFSIRYDELILLDINFII